MNTQFSNIWDVSHGATRGIDSERRQSLRLIYYWDHLRGDRTMPIEDDIDTDHHAIRDIWDHCFMVQVHDLVNKDPNYTYLGPAIIDAYQNKKHRFTHDNIVGLNASKLAGAYQDVIATKRPVLHSGEFDDGKGALVKFRQCLLPLGRSEVEVILGHVTYQVFAK